MNSYVPGANAAVSSRLFARRRGRRVRRRVGVGDRRDPRLVVADVDPRLAPPGCRVRRRRRERHRRVGLARRLEVRQRVGVGLDAARAARCRWSATRSGRGRGARTPATARSGSRRRSAAGRPRGSRCARRPSTGRSASSRNESNSELDPAPVARALVDRDLAAPRTAPAAPVGLRELRVVLRRQRPAELEVDRDPDLAVGVDLGPGDVVADVAEVQRVDLRVRCSASGNAPGATGSSPRSCGCRAACCRSRTCRSRSGSRRRSGRGRTR